MVVDAGCATAALTAVPLYRALGYEVATQVAADALASGRSVKEVLQGTPAFSASRRTRSRVLTSATLNRAAAQPART